MNTYLFRTRGIDNSYYPDKEDKYAFNEDAPNCNKLIDDIKTNSSGIKYYLYLIPTGEIVEKGIVNNCTSKNNMYYAIYEEREPLKPSKKLPKWPSPEKGIIPLSKEEIKEIENSI
ncbi:hypothetical protein [Halobacillus litoralis]|uniref:hypothetical protein n=1 Tax=Halobacillus litoralis TaxID=45668 RepID=UPI001CFD2D48|nr:hypothetical protein [Halobacillus litoralis]